MFMQPAFGRFPGSVLRKLALLLSLTSPLLVQAQGLTSAAPVVDPSQLDQSTQSPGFSPPKSFAPYSGEKRAQHFPAMQSNSAGTSGFNWAQFFRSAAQTGARFAAPRLFMANGQNQMGGDPLSPAGSGGMRSMAGGGSIATLGDSFNLSSRGVNFSNNSSALDLHLSIQSMFQSGWSQGDGGRSFAGSGLPATGEGLFGGAGGAGGLGGRDAGAGKGSGARISLQLKF
jgi:hypothetical protein